MEKKNRTWDDMAKEIEWYRTVSIILGLTTIAFFVMWMIS